MRLPPEQPSPPPSPRLAEMDQMTPGPLRALKSDPCVLEARVDGITFNRHEPLPRDASVKCDRPLEDAVKVGDSSVKHIPLPPPPSPLTEDEWESPKEFARAYYTAETSIGTDPFYAPLREGRPRR